MSLIKVNELLQHATEHHYGVPAINVINTETIRYAIQAAEDEHMPIIIQYWPGFEDHCALDIIAFAARYYAERASVPVAVHQDHSAGYEIAVKGVKAGDKVDGASSGTLAVIYDLSYLELEMAVDELDIGKVEVGQEVRITADALEGQTFSGVVDKVSINGTTANGATSYPVTIIIEDYGDLRPGMNVSAQIIGEVVPNALCIPVDAVERGNTVTVPGPGALSEDGLSVVDVTKLETKEVTLGRNDDEYIEVTDGLEEGDVVLISNQASSLMDMMMGG